VTPAPARIDDYNYELAAELAGRLRESKNEIVTRWLERISARVEIEQNKIFPGDDLLNHVPILIEGLASYLERPERGLDAEIPISAKAMELGALRHAQGFDAYEILKENELLGAIFFTFLAEIVDDLDVKATRRDFLLCWQRISEAIEVILQATMTHFLRLSAERVREREERLRRFNVLVSHELKNRVGAIRGGAELLEEEWLDAVQRKRFLQMIVENSQGLQRTLEGLVTVSRIGTDLRQQRNVLLPQLATEAARQLREQAEATGVRMEIAPDLPPVEVDAAGVELCLMNYISNAIKYHDPANPDPWVRIEADYRYTETADAGELVIRTRDNGLGVPPDARENLFSPFYRAHEHTITGVEGTGLGLSIVRQTAESLGGSAWAEFPEEGGSVFAFALPSRRDEDAAAAGTHRPERAGS
jgi:signal transduction histidine kinase